MLQDPIILPWSPITGTQDLARVSVEGGNTVYRKTVPAGGGALELSIRSSDSGENKGQTTKRHAIRLQQRKTWAPTEGGTVVPVTAQATLTVSVPENGFAINEVYAIVSQLILVLFTADGSSTLDVSDLDVDTTGLILPRILAGEA